MGSASQTSARFFDCPLPVLRPLDPVRAAEFAAELSAAATRQGCDRLVSRLRSDQRAASFLGALFDLSPYLSEIFIGRPAILEALFDADIDARILSLVGEMTVASESGDLSEAKLMAQLRLLKREAHGLIALADCAGLLDIPTATLYLTRLAEAAVGAAVRFLLRQAAADGKLKLADPAHPEAGSGWIILGMGKLGARELNYSSDIDLIVFIDDERPAVLDRSDCIDLFSKLTRRLVRILQERTAEGYVFRTDLRLRPDPGATPLAIPLEAALNYYEGRGQNWERAAMIKARPIAGDLESGARLLSELSPYVWRKYLDYAAIADVHSIKRQIHAHKGHGEIAVRGHNVKLGRGGIREIEFFVQTQQLIAGGRSPALRGSGTAAMLAALEEGGWITAATRDALTRRYEFLRKVEHRIQMVADEQTHILPEDDEGFARVARLMGYREDEAFAAEFREALRSVEKHYAALFEAAPELAAPIGNLVFTGDVDDPGTIETLTGLGFERPSDICRVIRTWHFGRYRATRSAEARERLTELTPALLAAFGATRRADESLMRFDEFIKGLPAGIQLFSLLHSNPALLDLIVLIMGAAPRLADIITRRPHVFDGMLDPAILAEVPTREYLAARLEDFLKPAAIYEDLLDRLRIFAAEQRFLIGIRLLTGAVDGPRAGHAFSDLADLVIGRTLGAVCREFERRHGRIKGGRIAILGMGKLGSRELTAGSDVDLILLYDHDAGDEESDGEKPLHVSVYYMRLTQRLMAALSSPTAEGILYEVDMRLRPSGNKGPVATHYDSFRKYQREQAWTWEHMALTRSRAVAGDADFAAKVSTEVEAILRLPRDARKVAADVCEMRAILDEEKPPRDVWDLKLQPGGIIDLEFIAQYAVLAGKTAHGVRSTSTADTLSRLDPGFAPPSTAESLTQAHRLYTRLTQLVRLCLTSEPAHDELPAGLVELLCRASDLPDLARTEANIRETAAMVRTTFRRLLGDRPGTMQTGSDRRDAADR